MASARAHHRKKQYAELVQGNDKLHKDIEDLETAYMIHKHYVDNDQNSVKGIIRKEIGGSRWEHGGDGKLYTYKSSRDLVEKEPLSNRTTSIRPNSSKLGHLTQTLNGSAGACDQQRVNVDLNIIGGDIDHGRLTDLKTKVLKKASSKVIHRNTWTKEKHSSPETNASMVKQPDKCDVNGTGTSDKSEKRKGSSTKHKKIKQDVKKMHEEVEKQKEKSLIVEPQNGNIDSNARRSRRDYYETKSKLTPNKTVPPNKDTVKSNTQSTQNENDEIASGILEMDNVRSIGTTYTPRKFDAIKHVTENGVQNNRVFLTQPTETTEIHIDPVNGQVRITSGQEVTGNLNLLSSSRTKVLIQPGSPKKSIDGLKLPCSIVDRDESPEVHNEVRDVFGFGILGDNLNTDTDCASDRSIIAKSPFATVRQCNTEVEFWLRGLDIPDVEKYVRIFSENDVDLTDLEFMSASQLHDMGINTFGALDGILKGIRNLKIRSPTKDRHIAEKKRSLDPSCIAWENGDDEHLTGLKVESDVESLISSKNREVIGRDRKLSQNNETFMRNSLHCDNSRNRDTHFRLKRSETFNIGSSLPFATSYEPVRRCGSAMSNVSGSTDLGSRIDNKHPSFAASTHASNAKCVDKRPPSAKSVSSVKSSSKQNSKTGSNGVNSGQKSQASGNKLRRSSSFTASDRSTKLVSLEEKPTKGALNRPRSNSLTRESSRPSTTSKSTKKAEQKKPAQSCRARSRSADAVKRKALEGVQAAARKFEERSRDGRDSDTATRQVKEERKKQKRDEMAARHLQRERFREVNGGQSSDTDDSTPPSHKAPADIDGDLESLVAVSMLSPPKQAVSEHPTPSSGLCVLPPINQRKGQLEDETMAIAGTRRSDVRKSLRRVEPPRKHHGQTLIKPVELHMTSPTEPSLKGPYKLCGREKERPQSEPESGYKTDGSNTYSQIEDRVSDIQLKIKRLKARASSGDEMTLTLVRDLQTQLQHFEKQLVDTNSRKVKTTDVEVDSISTLNTDKIPSSRPVSSIQSTRGDQAKETMKPSHPSNTVPEHLPRHTDAAENATPNISTSTSSKKAEKNPGKDKPGKQPLPFKPSPSDQRIRQIDPVGSMELDAKDITYKPEDVVGEGTFSRVYRGQYLGSEVAIKQLRFPLQTQDRNYFAAEVSLLKELRHPRVVLLIGVCTSTTMPLMVLELMSRGSLYNYLHNPQCESLDHALYYQVAKDIVQGMNYLHSHRPQVLHLDLKSMNVLLCESLRAKIADFGFSKLRHEAGSRPKSASKVKQRAPSWISPELLDKGEVTAKSDVYSFAIILWEMISRREPYEGVSLFKILEMVRKKERPSIPQGTPEGLRHLISLCWDHNPAKRPQFKEILQLLENLAFPPVWRELFQKAGVPNSALQDVKSTRNIISLVSGTLDSKSSGILQSFIFSQGAMGNQSNRSNSGARVFGDSKLSGKLEKSSSRRLSSIEREHLMNIDKSGSLMESLKSTQEKLDQAESKVTSGRPSRQGSARSSRSSYKGRGDDAWEASTVTTLSGRLSSDESDFTLKDLRESSSGSNCDSDLNRESSSEDETYIKRYLKRSDSPKKRVNVFVPSLELSLQSARDEFKAERERIAKDSDWTSISMDDKSIRSSFSSQDLSDSLPKDESLKFDMKLRLSSALGTTSPINDMGKSMTLNESARNRRREKHNDLPQYSEEVFMRESFDNRRRPSPKKRVPITQKLRNSSGKSTPALSLDSEVGDEFAKTEDDIVKIANSIHSSYTGSLKGESSVNASQDSFFGISNTTLTKDSKQRSSSSRRKTVDKSGNPYDSEANANTSVQNSQTMVHQSFNTPSTVQNTQNKVQNSHSNGSALTSSATIESARNSDSRKHSVNKLMKFDARNSHSTDLTKEFDKLTGDIDDNDDTNGQNGRSSRRHSSRKSARGSLNRQDSFEKSLTSFLTDDTGYYPRAPQNLISRLPKTDRHTDNGSVKVKEKSGIEARSMIGKISGGFNSDDISKSGPKGAELEQVERAHVTDKDDTKVKQDTQKDIQFNKSKKAEVVRSVKDGFDLVLADLTNNVATPRSPMAIENNENNKIKVPEANHENAKPQLDNPKAKSDKLKDGDPKTPHENIKAKPEYFKAKHMNQNENKVDIQKVKSETKPATLVVQPSPRKSDVNTSIAGGGIKKEDGNKEEIRVKLNIEEVEKGTKPENVDQRKKPVITPRRSKMNKSLNSDITDREKSDVPIRVSLRMIEEQQRSSVTSEANEKDEFDKTLETMITNESKSEQGKKSAKTNNDKGKVKNSVNQAPKKKTISVKLRKDPLVSRNEPIQRTSHPVRPSASPIPPAPPPPPIPVASSVTMVTRSVQDSAPRTSMADELKSRLATRQSISEGMRVQARGQGQRSVFSAGNHQPRKQPMVAESEVMDVGLIDINEFDEHLMPKQSDGLPAFMVQSLELKGQKDQLRSTSKPHPNQIDDLSNASQEQLSSIADILKKAVLNRRLALGEDGDDVTHSMESVATGWSVDCT